MLLAIFASKKGKITINSKKKFAQLELFNIYFLTLSRAYANMEARLTIFELWKHQLKSIPWTRLSLGQTTAKRTLFAGTQPVPR
jgi:hypothetical protein